VKMFGGHARMFARAPLWLSTGLHPGDSWASCFVEWMRILCTDAGSAESGSTWDVSWWNGESGRVKANPH